MKILEFHVRIIQIKKMLEFKTRIMKIMKILQLHVNDIKNAKNEFVSEKHEHHENLKISRENYENQ